MNYLFGEFSRLLTRDVEYMIISYSEKSLQPKSSILVITQNGAHMAWHVYLRHHSYIITLRHGDQIANFLLFENATLGWTKTAMIFDSKPSLSEI
jgi:hypothetical protein